MSAGEKPLKTGAGVTSIPGWPLALVLFFTGVMVWLGFWQLQRAEEKRQLLALLASGQNMTVASAEGLQSVPRYAYVQVTGRFLDSPQFVLENKVRHKRLGYAIFTPLVIPQWRATIMVNRGWIDAREFDMAALQPDTRLRSWRLRIDKPPKTGVELGEVQLEPEAPVQKMVYYTPEKISAVIRYQRPDAPPVLEERVFLLEADQPAGFDRQWKPVIIPPSRHIGYAVQWFGLTLTLWILFIFWLRKQRD